MSDEYEYSPWIEHDGKGAPHDVVARFDAWPMIQRRFSCESGRRCFTLMEQSRDEASLKNPGWAWRWKGGLFRKRRRVCVDPDYRPIVEYRFVRRKPPAAETSESFEMLRVIAAGAKAPEPERAREVSR